MKLTFSVMYGHVHIILLGVLLLDIRICLARRRKEDVGSAPLSLASGSGLFPLLAPEARDDAAPYTPWSSWSRCSRHCTQHRRRHCLLPDPEGCSHDHSTTAASKETRLCRRASCSPHGMRKNSLKKRRNKQPQKKKAASEKRIEQIIYELLYNDWAEWGSCTRSCKRRRYRTCALSSWCRDTVLMDESRCAPPGSTCEKRLKDRKQHEDRTDRKHRKSEAGGRGSSSLPPAAAYNDSVCGLREIPDKQLRIVGGYESRRGSWPWQVAILTKWHEQYCGGVLISPNWVLTAAHCVRQKAHRRRRLLVRVAEHDLSIDEGPEIDIQIQDHFLHPQFSLDTIDYDIALLRLRSPVLRSVHVGYACLPPTSAPPLPEKTLCYAVGWGKMQNTHLFGTDVLREASVPIVNKTECRDAFDYEITEYQLCAGYKTGGVDTCSGDSGGPLMCRMDLPGKGERWSVYGVTSFGEGCGDNGKYGIYTQVPYFNDWIRETMENN